MVILVVSVTGFWFADRSGLTKTGVRGLTPQTINGDAFQHYQQGRVLIERGHGGDFQTALASFERAIELDPNYAAAYAGKADAKTWIFWGSTKPDDIIQVRTAINRRSNWMDRTVTAYHFMPYKGYVRLGL